MATDVFSPDEQKNQCFRRSEKTNKEKRNRLIDELSCFRFRLLVLLSHKAAVCSSY